VDACFHHFNGTVAFTNCGEFGTCLRESSNGAPGGIGTEILTCRCLVGWSNNDAIGADGIRGRCRIEDPCQSSVYTCNVEECGSSCLCTTNTGPFLKRDGTGFYGSYYRLPHTCDCGADFYSGPNLTDPFYPGTGTCYKKKCVVGDGVTSCTEVEGKDPVYGPCERGWSGPACDQPDYCIIDDYDIKCTDTDTKAHCRKPLRIKDDPVPCICSFGFSGKFCDEQDFCQTKYASSTYCGRYGECDSDRSTEIQEVCRCQPG